MLDNLVLTNILLIIVLLMNIITMILVIVLIKKKKTSKDLEKEYQVSSVQIAAATGSDQGKGYADSGVVFCRSCGTQYDSANSACPVCKSER